MPDTQLEATLDRRTQILDAALVCFAKRGFHQASMHDISTEAGISVGLIYRYFQNKEAVISAMADRHKQKIHEILERARQAPGLLESLEILFTAHCGETEPHVISAFVVDVCETSMNGVTDLIAQSSASKATNLTPREMAELIFAVNDGMLMRDVLKIGPASQERREQQLKVARNLWPLLFNKENK